jgi:hypothetical protein
MRRILADRPRAAHQRPALPEQGAGQHMATGKTPSVVRVQLRGAAPHPEVAGLEELPGMANYFVGNDLAQWHTAIPTYAQVQYQAVYPASTWSTTPTRGSWRTTL